MRRKPAHRRTPVQPTSRLKRVIRTRWFRIACVPLVLTILWFAADWGGNALFPVRQDYNFGTSFSIKRSTGFGLDWKVNFTALLDDLKIRQFRLMSYWDLGEPTPGHYDFRDLDWQVSEAAKRGASVSLSIGLRQPRWPECYQPTWADAISQTERNTTLERYITAVIKHYEHNSTIQSWQLENEALNSSFGTCGPVDRTFLRHEASLVKGLTTKPLIMSLSDQYGYPLNAPIPDVFGFSIYRIVYDGRGFYINFSTPLWYHRLRAAILTAIWHKPVIVHELQLEPWGPADIPKLSVDEQNKSMSIDQIHSNIRFARQLGTDDVYTWGSEWWYWRKEKLHDPSVWNAVREEINDSRK